MQSAFLKGYKIKVADLDPKSGKLRSQYTLSSEGEIASPSSLIFVGANAASPIIVWADKERKALKINILGSKNINTVALVNNSGQDLQNIEIHAPHVLNSSPHFLVGYQTKSLSWAEVYHTDLKSSAITKSYQLPLREGSSTFATSSVNGNIYFTRITNSDITLVSSSSHEVLSKRELKSKLSEPAEHAAAEVAVRGSTYAVRFAQVSGSGDWELVRNGESEWTRFESLADSAIAAWADLDGEKELAHELELEGHESIYSAYVHRLKRHAKALRYFPSWLQQLPVRIFQSFLPGDNPDLSQFGFNKLVIVATRKGRVLALDSGRHGQVRWSTRAVQGLENDWNVKEIVVFDDAATILVDDGSFLKVRLTSGEIIERGSSNTRVSSYALVANGKSPLAIGVGPDGTPDLPSAVSGTRSFLVTRSDAGGVLGWDPTKSSTPVWEFVPPKGQSLIDITVRPGHDPVASIGKVLGNRSVLYKYLNPNIALVTAISASSVSFYLLDGISGQVLHTVTHSGVDTSQPITSALSENWFAYSLGVDVADTAGSKGYQLVVSELYESPLPNDRGPLGNTANYSSVHSITRPHVISQAYMIAEPISHMTVSQTRQGITIRQLLCTLPASNAIVGIPRPILDPRRPVGRDPTATEAEEGLAKYRPFLDFDPRWYLTHSRDVFGVENILSSQTLLESTSLVFAYGFDVFGTRITPSQAFDILGKGFSKVQLLLTVVALGAGVSVLSPLVSQV